MVIQCNPFVANPPIFEIVGDPSPNPPISRRPCTGDWRHLFIYVLPAPRRRASYCLSASAEIKVSEEEKNWMRTNGPTNHWGL